MKSGKAKIEFEKLKTMSFKDKFWYIWEYYKIPIIGIIAGVFIIASLLSTMLNHKETLFTCYAVNNPIYGESYDQIRSGFSEYAGLAEENWELDASMVVGWGDSATGYEYVMKITAVIASGGLDVLLSDEATVTHYGSMAGLLDLETFLPAALLEQVQDDLIYITTEEGNRVACAIRLDQSPVLESANITEPLYYSIISNSPHTEVSIQFLEYLLGH